MTILVALVLIVVAVASNAPATSDDIATNPRVRFHPDQSRYLSTESASGTLEIENLTGSDIGYNPITVSFLIRDADGRQHEQRWIATITRIIPDTWIEPGESHTFRVGLPNCDVLSDPCTERVAVKFTLWTKTKQLFPMTTPEFSYTFVPDPTATFRIDGLRDNRPLFISQGEARETVASSAKGTSETFATDQDVFDPVFGHAGDQAKDIAAQLAAFLGTDPLGYANGLRGEGQLLQFSPHDAGDLSDTEWLTYGDLLFNDAVRQRLKSAARPLDAVARSTQAFVGATAIVPKPQTFGSAPQASEYFYQNMRGFEWMPLSASIAADRPEVYVVVRLRRESCLRSGYDCRAVGLELATHRVRALAQSLGVGVRFISLVAAYKDATWSTYDTVVPLGLAMTMTNEPSAMWHTLPTPLPTARSPMGFLMTPVPHPTAMPAMNLHTPPPDIVPIDVPDPGSMLEARGDVQRTVTADELRLDVRIDAADPNYSGLSTDLPGHAGMVAKLLAEPSVVDVASQADRPDSFPLGYEMLVTTYDRVRIERLLTLIRTSYRRMNVVMRYQASTALNNCGDDILRAQALSSQAAMQRAVNDAHGSGRLLRRLVLAAAYPPNAPDACVQGAQLSPLDRARSDRLELPADRSVTIDVPVKLVFRILPPIAPTHSR
ncbi:MAG TPA: hypothetical protein VGQ96_03805 [Candidatus Eremiobacteraceae bacterium]|nr:hypothetical protein [Candidatus Eremiobacteraceae bacterium]